MKKALVIALIIIILGLGGWLILKPNASPKNNQIAVQQPSKSHNSQLKKYDNKHISLQYPSSWKVVSASGSPDEFVTLEGPTDPAIPIKEYANEHTTRHRSPRRVRVYAKKAEWTILGEASS